MARKSKTGNTPTPAPVVPDEPIETFEDNFGDDPQTDIQSSAMKSPDSLLQPPPGDDAIPPDDTATAAPESAVDGDAARQPDLVETQTEQIEWPPELLAQSGMTAEQAQQAFGDPEVMERALRWHDQQIIARTMAQQPGQAAQSPPIQTTIQAPVQQPAIPPQQATQTPGATTTQTPQGFMFKPFEIPKGEDGEPVLNEEAVNVLTAMDNHYRQQMEGLAQSILPVVNQTHLTSQQLMQERLAEAQRQYVSEFDRRINDLGPEWKDTFGEGDGLEIARSNPNDPALQNRIKLDQTMAALRLGRAQQQLPPLDDEQLFQRALAAEFGNQIQQTASRQAAVGQRRNLATARPTQRRAPPVNADARTLQAVDSLLRSRGQGGLSTGDYEAVEDNFAG